MFLPYHTVIKSQISDSPFLLYSYLGLMEAAEGEAAVPIVVVRREDCGVSEVQVARGRRPRTSRDGPREGGVAREEQQPIRRMDVASTDISQRRTFCRTTSG